MKSAFGNRRFDFNAVLAGGNCLFLKFGATLKIFSTHNFFQCLQAHLLF